jgi:hypothetical protein
MKGQVNVATPELEAADWCRYLALTINKRGSRTRRLSIRARPWTRSCLSQLHPCPIFTTCLPKIVLMWSIFFSWSFKWKIAKIFPQQNLRAFLVSSTPATFRTHRSFLHVTALTITGYPTCDCPDNYWVSYMWLPWQLLGILYVTVLTITGYPIYDCPDNYWVSYMWLPWQLLGILYVTALKITGYPTCDCPDNYWVSYMWLPWQLLGILYESRSSYFGSSWN